MFDIQEELKKLPAKPGVYLMHNAQDEISMSVRQESLRTVCVSIFRVVIIRV